MNNLEDALRDFLEPILDFLSTNLPPPLYSITTTFLSYSFAAVTALASLCASLLSDNPTNWNTQTLLPPIITILAAYLALLSIYRTTTWLARTMFWFLKWGSMFGLLMAGAGYFMGNAGNGGGNALGNQGAISLLGGNLGKMFNVDAPTHRTQKTRSSKKPQRNPRPKSWESFNRHNEWKDQQQNPNQNRDDQFQQLMNMVTGAAGQVLGGNWWSLIKNFEMPNDKLVEAQNQDPKDQRSRKMRSR